MTVPWFINVIVIIGVAYLSFAMALAGWLTGLKRGEAVTLIKTKGNSQRGFGVQIALVIFSLVITILLFYWLWIPLPVKPSSQCMLVFMFIGLALFIIGTFIILWARQTLGRMWGISTSREVKLLSDHRLIDQGPYGLVRHPMYFGWWLATLGLIFIYWTWIIIIVFLSSVLVFYRRAQREETVLAERFGEQWLAYKTRSHYLIPWIY